jgi:divalent metal cation (Fe/Co/Zn/Cd) transporter
MDRYERTIIIFALCANLAIAVSKFIAAVVTGSGSMMAESIHSLADCGKSTRNAGEKL